MLRDGHVGAWLLKHLDIQSKFLRDLRQEPLEKHQASLKFAGPKTQGVQEQP